MHAGGAYSGVYDIDLRYTSQSSWVSFTCPTPGCINTAQGWSTISYYASTSTGTPTLTVSYLQGVSKSYNQVHTIFSSSWTRFIFLMPSGQYDGIEFTVSPSSVFETGDVYIDDVVLS